MADEDMLVIAPDRRRHASEMYALLNGVFGKGDSAFGNACRDFYIGRSHYDWRASRIGVLKGRAVTHWGVWDYQMRIGSGRLRVGGIGAVGTHPDHRRRGFLSRTARASLRAMYELGYDMTRLGGIPKFYDRFGYVRGWSETSYFVKADELPARSGVRTKKFKVRHREDLARLYNRQYARTTGTAVRPTFLVHALAVHRWEGHMWTDPGGEPSGYVVVKKADDGDLLKCCEYVGDAETALGVIAKLARRRKCSGVEFNSIPYASELARRLRGGNCRAEVHYRRCAGSLIRTVNLRAAISKLCGEFSRRVKNSPFGSWRGNLLVCDAREEVTVAIDRGRVHVAPPKATKHTIRGGEEVAQLVLGTETPQETVRAAGMRLTGDAKYLVEVLFPDQHPTLSFADRF